MSSADMPPEECANCGARIPRTAKVCPECGADEQTGWREASPYDGLDLPDTAFEDDHASLRRGGPTRRVNGIAWYWWVVGILLLLLIAIGRWLV